MCKMHIALFVLYAYHIKQTASNLVLARKSNRQNRYKPPGLCGLCCRVSAAANGQRGTGCDRPPVSLPSSLFAQLIIEIEHAT